MSELNNFDNFFRLDGKVALVTGGRVLPRVFCIQLIHQDRVGWGYTLQRHFSEQAQRRSLSLPGKPRALKGSTKQLTSSTLSQESEVKP